MTIQKFSVNHLPSYASAALFRVATAAQGKSRRLGVRRLSLGGQRAPALGSSTLSRFPRFTACLLALLVASFVTPLAVYADESGTSKRVSALEEAVQALTQALADETVDRGAVIQALEQELGSEIAARIAAISSLQTALNTEKTARETADTNLTNELASESADRQTSFSALTASFDTEKTARETADTNLAGALETERTERQSAISTLTTDLAKEILTRETADTNLASDLLLERTERQASDTAIANVQCPLFQALPGNPSDAVIELCGELLFKTVFVTSSVHSGNLMAAGGGSTGLDGADKICNARAQDAGLPGSYTAWLSDTNVDARDRITKSTVPYKRPDGSIVAESFAVLAACEQNDCLQHPLSITEQGGVIQGVQQVWTATARDGTKSIQNGGTACNDWTADVSGGSAVEGNTDFVRAAWTEGFANSCQNLNRLFCFQD